MTQFEISFVVISGPERSYRIHSTKGWCKYPRPLDRDLKVIVRENTNIQEGIEIISFREVA